jgi:ketosteroid isomerase-like protein
VYVRVREMASKSELWDRFQTAMATQDLEGVVSLFAPDGVYMAYGMRHEGRDGIREWLRGWMHTFSDVGFEAAVVLEDGDVTIGDLSYYLVQSKPLTMPNGSVMPASGRVLDGPGVTVLRTLNGQITDARDYSDQLDELAKLGVIPSA